MGQAISTGKGTPWQGATYGEPGNPNYQDYNNDPNSFQGYDNSAQKAQLLKDIGEQGQNTEQNYLSNSAKGLGGVARSSGTAGNLANIAAQTENQKNAALAGLSQEQWKSKMDLMNAYNNAVTQANARKQNQYDIESKNWNQQENAKQQRFDKFGQSMNDWGKSFAGGMGG